jgi:hypothetical protein
MLKNMLRVSRVTWALTASCLLLAVIAGCASQPNRTQQFAAMENALGFRNGPDGPPNMTSHAFPAGTDQSTITVISADAPEYITLLSAELIALPGFRAPQLISAGVIAGHCPRTEVILPAAPGQPSPVIVNGRKYQPLPLRGTRIEIGGGCFAELIYVVRAKSTGQYAAGGLRVLVRRGGQAETMFAYDGTDIWYYNSGPLPSAHQIVIGLRATYAAQVAFYRSKAR